MKLNSDIYLIDSCYRTVKDYPYEYKTWAKSRWFGKTLIKVLMEEYSIFSEDYYVELKAFSNQ